MICQICKICIVFLTNYRVRDIFIATLEAPRRLDFQEILFREGMQVLYYLYVE